MAIKLNDVNFEEEVIECKKFVLVDFYSDNCVPCKVMALVMERIEIVYNNKFKTAMINVTECDKIAKKYGVSSVPCFVMFKDGREAGRAMGSKTFSDVDSWIKKFF